VNIDDKLSQVFDVTPIGNTEVLPQVAPQQIRNDQLDDDYETTRSNLHTILQQGQDALYHALEVAKASEHPRAFEVVGGLMKHLSDINTQLLDLHKKKQSIEAPTKEERKSVTNNAIFVGSTNELSKMLNDLRKGK
jgi:hypothetical protein